MLIDVKKRKKRESRASKALCICTDGGEGPRPTLRSRPPATHVPRKSNRVDLRMRSRSSGVMRDSTAGGGAVAPGLRDRQQRILSVCKQRFRKDVLRISGSRWRGASAVVGRINSLLIAGVNISLMIVGINISLMIVSIDISITGNGSAGGRKSQLVSPAYCNLTMA
jgi:hypothetical protein